MTKVNQTAARRIKSTDFSTRKMKDNLSAKHPKKSSEKIQCNLCDMAFFYKTSLAAHKKTHTNANSCQHCHRSFAISTGLFKHLREHCVKISVAERKRLLGNDRKSSVSNGPAQKTSEIRTPKLRASPVDQLKAVRFPPGAGIRLTPWKLIKCYNCGEKFTNPHLYATHSVSCAADKAGKSI